MKDINENGNTGGGNVPGPPAKRKRYGVKGAVITACAVVAVIAAALVAGCFYVRGLDTIYPNLAVGGVNVGGMTKEQAAAALEASPYSDMAENIRCDVSLPDGSSIEINGEDIGLVLHAPQIAELAYAYGRDGSFFSNALAYVRCSRGPVDISSGVAGQMDEVKLESVVLRSVYELEKQLGSAPYTVGEKEITIVKGAGSSSVDKDALYTLVYDSLCESLEKAAPIYTEYKLDVNGDTELDLREIYDEVFVEPVSAEFDPETDAATQDVVGVSFDLRAAESMYKAAEPGETVRIDLILTEPEVTTDGLNELLFRDVLSEVTTTLSGSSSNRINNITLAAAAVNGTVLAPGEEFSFNGVVGERTTAKGYKAAGAYSGGKTVQEVGGGICQMSSSLYYCELYADLKTVYRANHMFTISYLPLGLDATVSWGAVDYVFQNDKDYPVKIEAFTENNSLTVRMYGTKLDDTYIDVDYEVLGVTYAETVYEESDSVAPGDQKVDTYGHTGYVVNTYKYLYEADGTLISKTFIARSSYSSQDKVILVAPGELPGSEPAVPPETPPETPPELPPETPPETPPGDGDAPWAQ